MMQEQKQRQRSACAQESTEVNCAHKEHNQQRQGSACAQESTEFSCAQDDARDAHRP